MQAAQAAASAGRACVPSARPVWQCPHAAPRLAPPLQALDISDDDTIIATASADKNVKLWGLDFGDLIDRGPACE